ncbi:MAG: Zn-ribbon domain-containing OB-fold protein [Candidatus Kariarchaeaceae archaeon]
MTDKKPIGYKCVSCGKVHYPKHGRCLKCKETEFSIVELPSEGTLVTWTMLKAPPSGIDKFSLYLGIVDLGEVKYTGQIEVENPDDLELGTKLRAVWKQVRVIDGKPKKGFVWIK